MLDQNTDRMWFVIGAVIVGAAIIFIANGSLPTLFASVSDSFEDVSDKGLAVVDSIGELDNLLDESQIGVSHQLVDVSWMGWDYVLYELQFDEHDIGPGDTVTLKFYVEDPATDVQAFMQVRDNTNDQYGYGDGEDFTSGGNIIKAGESGWTSITWTLIDYLENGNEPERLMATIRNKDKREIISSSAKYSQASIVKH